MPLGLARRLDRISQLRAGGDGGALENEIRLALVVDNDTVPPPTVETAVQAVTIPATQDTDSVQEPSLAHVIALPATQDADSIPSPSLDMSILAPLVTDADTVPGPVVAPGAVEITIPATQDADTPLAPVVSPGAVAITPPAVQDADSIPSPTVENDAGQTVTLPATQDADTAPGPTLDMNVVMPATQDADTVLSPSIAATIALPATQDADTVNGPVLDMNVAIPATQDADTVGQPTLDMTVVVPSIQDTDTALGSTVAFPSQSVTVPAVQDADTVNQPTLDMNVALAAVQDADTIPTLTVEGTSSGITIGNVSSGVDATSDQASISHTPASGTTRLVIVGCFHGASSTGAAATYSCTVGGDSADQRAVGEASSDRDFPNLVQFSFDNPTTGSPLTVTVTQSSSNAGLRNAIHVIDLIGAATGASSTGDVQSIANGTITAFDFAMDAAEADSIFVACVSRQGGTDAQPLDWDAAATERSEVVSPASVSGVFAALSGMATQPSAGTGTTDNNVGGDFTGSDGGQGCCVEYLAA